MADMMGKIVIQVNCDGCMAEDHKIMQVGRVVAIRKAKDIWGVQDPYENRYDFAQCLVINSHLDAKDEYFYVCIQDSSLQPSKGHWMVYFHYQ